MDKSNQEFKTLNSLIKCIRLGRREQFDFWFNQYQSQYINSSKSIKYKNLFEDILTSCISNGHLHLFEYIQIKFPDEAKNNMKKLLLISSYMNNQKGKDIFHHIWNHFEKLNNYIEQKFFNTLMINVITNKNDYLLNFFIKNYQKQFIAFHKKYQNLYPFIFTKNNKNLYRIIYTSNLLKILQTDKKQFDVKEKNIMNTLDVLIDLKLDINGNNNHIMHWTYLSYGVEMLKLFIQKYNVKISLEYQKNHSGIMPIINKILYEKKTKKYYESLLKKLKKDKTTTPTKSLKNLKL